MPEKPILFSCPMVRAILDGRKTQTRRVAKIPAITGNMVSIGPHEDLIELEAGEFKRGICNYASTSALSGPYSLPYAVGDRLWVRETLKRDPDLWKYAADGTPVGWPARQALASKPLDYAPSIHMPRAASRITLIVTDVRVQRLQDISEADAIAEGVEPAALSDHWRDYGPDPLPFASPVESYRSLWNSLNASRGSGWDTNPWVVAVTFERESSDA